MMFFYVEIVFGGVPTAVFNDAVLGSNRQRVQQAVLRDVQSHYTHHVVRKYSTVKNRSSIHTVWQNATVVLP